MRKLQILLFAALFNIEAFAQAPQSFNYQLIARDTAGMVLSNHSLGIKISILQNSVGGAVVFSERHTATTNLYGLVNIAIGTGSVLSGSFQPIEWGTHLHYIKLEIDPAGGTNYFTLGITQLVSVPYALYAEKAGSLADPDVASKWTQDGDNIYNNNTGNVGIGTSAPSGKLIVQGDSSAPATDPLFEVKNKDGDPVLVVYPDSVRITFSQDALNKANAQGGFAVSGRSSSKGATSDYLVITPDSARIYLNEYADKANAQGGFAVSGRSSSKGATSDYLSANSDSVKVSKSLYIPRMTTLERDNISFTPNEALIIFNLSDKCMQIYENGVWSNIWCFNCAPDFIIQPVNDTVCSQSGASFSVSLTGTNLVYQWQTSSDSGSTWSDIVNNATYSGAKTWKLTLTNVPLAFNGYKYRCNVTSSCPPAVTSNVVILYVKSTPPTISIQPTHQPLSTARTATFTISTAGFDGSYRWQDSPDGTTWSNISDGGAAPFFSGATTSSLSLSNVPVPYNNYQIRCGISNSCGASAYSNAVHLIITVPVLTTAAATNITGTSAVSGGNITDDGGASVTARGVCWNTSPNPTLADNYTNNGAEVGSFTSNITGLALGVTYYARAYATNSAGTAYGNQISFITFVIGMSYQGGVIAYILQSGDPGYDPGVQHGLIAATSDQSTGIPWYNGTYTNTGANGTALGTGSANTLAIIASQGAGSYAAKLCADLSLNGYDDWFLPSKDELGKLCQNKSAIGGFSNNSYWSSTEGDGYNAWIELFEYCNLGWSNKPGLLLVRAVRSF